MFALNVFDIPPLMFFLQLGLESLLSVFCGSDHTISLQELLFEIFSLQLLEEEFCLQTMIELLLFREELVCNLYHRVIVPEAIRILVTTKLVWDVALKVVLNV